MEFNKWVIGTAAFAGGILVGKNWKKISAYTTKLYENIKSKAVKTQEGKPAKRKGAKAK